MNPLRLLFFGLLLSLALVPGNGWAFIPGLVGAILIVVACRQLTEQSGRLAGLRWLVLAQILIALAIIVLDETPWSRGAQEGFMQSFGSIIGIVAIAVHLTGIYLVCGGIADVAARNWLSDLQATAMRRWRFYRTAILLSFAVPVIVMMIMVLSSTRGRGLGGFFVVVAFSRVLPLVALLAVLELVWRAGTLLKSRVTPFRP